MRIRALGIGFIAVLIIGASAVSANAAKGKLWLTQEAGREGGAVRITPGGSAGGFIELSLEGANCESVAKGTDVSNGGTSDQLKFSTGPSYDDECETEEHGHSESYIIHGNLASATFTSAGKLKLKASPKLVIGEPQFCVYYIVNADAEFTPLPDHSADARGQNFTGSVTAKLDHALTLGESCAATQTISFRSFFYGPKAVLFTELEE